MKHESKISKVILAVLLTVLVVVAVTATVVLAQSPDELDDDGNYRDSSRQYPAPGQLSPQDIGDVLNSFPNPSALAGLTFREGRLWGVTAGETGSGILYEMNADSGAVLSTITISPLPSRTFGLGFDTSRDVFVVTNALSDVILKVDPTTAAVIDSFPSPGPSPVGAAYDSTRDGYWISDFSTGKVHLVNPDTGAEITSLPVPSGASRIAGTGYDPNNDVIMFHSRDSAETYLIRASDGVQVGVFPTPPSPGVNNGHGAAIRPTDLTGYLTRSEVATIFVVDVTGTGTNVETNIHLPIILNSTGPPATPVLDPIDNGDGDGNYTVGWSAVSGATSYTLEEDDNAAFSSPTTVYSGSGTSKSITGKNVGTYYYRVKASNTSGSSGWSNIKSVAVTVSPPPCPQTGSWSGTTNQGYPISFTVSDTPSCQAESLRIQYRCTCTHGSVTVITTFVTPISISSNHFDTGGSAPKVIGDFTSQTAASGTWSSSFYDSYMGLCSGSGTWTANYSP